MLGGKGLPKLTTAFASMRGKRALLGMPNQSQSASRRAGTINYIFLNDVC